MKCPSCGTELAHGVKFCFECGAKQGPARQALFSDREVAEIEARSQPDEYVSKLRQIVNDGIAIERRDVAVLFVDVSGFTPMSSRLPSEQLREVMSDLYAVMSGAITRCGGYVDKFIGDEVMAIFGAPIALERPCERAITAVDEIEIGLTGVNYRFKDILQMPFSVHAGIAFGQVDVGKLGESQKLEYTILGETVNLAKRLTDAAFAKMVFVSGQVKRLSEEAFDFDSLGVQQLPGVSIPLEVFRVVGPKPVSGERVGFSQLGARMFGRDAEFDMLKAAFGVLQTCYPDPKPCAAGEGKFREFSHIFGITGEAGIGKSRLKRELRRHVQELLGKDGARVLTGGAWSIGQTPLYWPIKEQIASALGFEPTASSEAIGAGLSKLKDNAALEAEHIPYLHHLFGLKDPDNPIPDLEPKSIKDNLWIAIRKLYEHWSLEKPLVLVFEDTHWADGSTRDFVEYLSDFVSDFPVLVLLLYRPGYEPKFAKRERVPFTELLLQPLSKDAETDLLSFYLADGQAERALIRRLRRYSEGNPLFAEEFLHMLLERGKLKLEEGKMRLTEEVQKMPLPTGLSGVLGERFDRLARGDKRVAYYGAVIGRSFLHSLLSDLHDRLHGSPEVRDALRTLLAREIIFERAVEPDLEYIFKHALTREMLVSRLVESLRRELSRLIAMRIEDLFRDRLDEFYGTLSEHWEVAGDLAKAARHAAFHAINDQKQQRNFEALDAFERYDRLSKCVGADPRVCPSIDAGVLSSEERADLLDSRISLLHVLGRRDEAIPLCDELAELAGGKWRAKSLNWRASLKMQTSDWDEAIGLASEAFEVAQQTRDRKAQARAIREIGVVHWARGDYDEALGSYSEALAMYRELGDKGGIARVVGNIGNVHGRRGDYDEALRCYGESLAMRGELGDKSGVATVAGSIGLVHSDRGDYDEALRYYEQSLGIFRELGDKSGVATVAGSIGLVHSDRGDYDEALRYYGESLAMHRELGEKAGTARVVVNIGTVHRVRGAYDEALRYNREALATFRELGDKHNIAIGVGNIGLVHWSRGDYDEALRCYGESLAMRGELGDKPGIAIVVVNIGLVHSDRGDYDEALRYYEQSLGIFREFGDKRGIAIVVSNIGNVHWSRGDYDEALRYYQEALAMRRELGDKSGTAIGLTNIASVLTERGLWAEAKKAALEAEQLFRETGDATYAPEMLSILCRAAVAGADWPGFLSYEAVALRAAEDIGNQEQSVLCRLNLSKAHVQVVRWFDEGKQGEPPPLSREEAIAKAADYAAQARELAESKGMKGYVKKAEELLAKIEDVGQGRASIETEG